MESGSRRVGLRRVSSPLTTGNRARWSWPATTLRVVLLLLAGCKMASVVGPDYAGPWLYYKPGQAAERVTFGESEFVRQSECVGYATTRLRVEALPLRVDVFDQMFLCNGKVLVNGCTWPDKLWVDSLYFERVLSHELVHWFSMKNGGPPDYAHEGWVWKACDRLNPPGSYQHVDGGGVVIR